MNMQMASMTRRGFLTAGAATAGMAALTAGTPAQAENAAVEKANYDLVLRMYKDIESLDPEKYGPYLADTVQFQIAEGMPIIKGKEMFLNTIRNFSKPYKRAEWEVHRMHVIGNLVINERTDRFIAKEGGKDAAFRTSGFCWIKDGLVYEWRDYRLPE